jgi:hypothetical protein
MAKKQTITKPKDSSFRVIFNTADGSKVMDRGGTGDYYFLDERRRVPDLDFINITLKKDSAEKGVRIVKYELTKDSLIAIVDWL